MPEPHDEEVRDDRDSVRDDPDSGRDETSDERADRNWNELLQELRVMQTGTQILTGFLLALAFQPTFGDLSDGQTTLYLVLVVLAALASIFALAPVALHRVLFQRHVKRVIVFYGHAALILSLLTVSVLLVGVVTFVFDVVASNIAAIVALIVFSLLIAVLWALVPAIMRARYASKAGR